MSFKKAPGWKIYRDQMSQLDYGDALWEPAPLNYFERVQLGDVGYVRRGCFHLLFSAGKLLGARQLGVNVPLTFQPLDVEPIVTLQPRLPGCLSTSTTQETGASLGTSVGIIPMLEPGFNISFEHSERQGAALVTKFPTHREEVQREQLFEEYTRQNYDSWVAFAREGKHGNDVKPVLVTGLDITRDFAMMSYLNNGMSLKSEFTASVPGVVSTSVSAWGTWRTEGLVHTNCGPQLCLPSSSPQTADLPFSGVHTTIPVEYNQCVFVRYYTMRKWPLLIPRVIKAAAGPHDLGPGDRDNDEPPVGAQYHSDESPVLFYDNLGGDGGSFTRIGSDSSAIFHNTTSDAESDAFDIIADYIFRNSNATSVLAHHRDFALLRKTGGSTTTLTQLLEKQPHIIVDKNGEGRIQHNADLSTCSGLLDTTPTISSSTSSIPPLKSRPPSESPLESPPQRAAYRSQGTIDNSTYSVCSVYEHVIVPQRPYAPGQGARILEALEPQKITFRKDGTCGIPVRDGVSKRFNGLEHRDSQPFEGVQVADQATLRIEWPGYPSWSTYFRTRDSTPAKKTANLSRLAEQICKGIHKFIIENEDKACDDYRWRVGGDSTLNVDNLVLVSLERASYGSWVAVIHYRL